MPDNRRETGRKTDTTMTTPTQKMGATRAMFHSSTSLNHQLRGPMVTYDVDKGDGSAAADAAARVTAEAATVEAAEKVTADAAAAEAARIAALPEAERPKPTDAEAKLLKETMKHKKAATDAAAALATAEAALAAYKGADPTKVAALVAAEADAERKALEAKGEYDRILEQVTTQHTAALGVVNEALAASNALVEAANRQIDELTVGTAFGNSKFLSTETVLSPSKARKLYGDHFEQVDGKTVGYDKPRGATERTPLVDGTGANLTFEAAIEKIVRGDEDFERIAKSKLKSGSGSLSSDLKTEEKKDTPGAGVSRIAANLGKITKHDPKAK